ncbi:immunoglobulin-like domain-containing protein, partial [Halolactibacillus miurensis]
GEYRAGETVMIEANTPNAVQKFVRWNTFTSKVNVTDPLKSQTTFVMPANDVQIQAVYEDLSDEEIKKQLQEAANDLTISKAFTFSEDDTWESVTLEFLMLTEGINNTTINWVSSKTNVISIDGSIASTNRQEDDESVILTATILKAGQSIQKTFLLIVKSDQIDNKVYEVERRPADVQMNTSQQAHDLIQRISLYNNKDELINKIDKIIINDDLVGLDTPNLFSVYLSDDLTNLADELAIEITNSALKKMTGNLEVKTDQAIIQINEEELIRLNESVLDLFFRIVPVRDVESKKAIQTRMEADILYQEFIQSFSPDAQAKIVGTPKEIETNYSGYQTTVTLPLDEFYASLTNLNNLRVYIEHSDGTINIQAGQIIYDQGNPIGFQFTIDKFSTFTLFEVEMQSETNPDPEDKPDQDNGNSNDLEGEIPIDEDKNEDNQFNDDDQELSNTNSSDDQTNTDTTDDEDYMNDSDTDKTINESELPNTASIMFTNMLIGMMLMVSGFVLALIYRKKYVNHQE